MHYIIIRMLVTMRALAMVLDAFAKDSPQQVLELWSGRGLDDSPIKVLNADYTAHIQQDLAVTSKAPYVIQAQIPSTYTTKVKNGCS